MIKRMSFVVIALTIIAVVSLFMLIAVAGIFLYKNSIIIKSAVKENELIGKSYILCERAIKTKYNYDWFPIKDERTERNGYNWILIKNENGERSREYFNIIGTDPFDEFGSSIQFEVADNTFIFYITEKRRHYSEELRGNVLEYTVTGWDILYPVIHIGSYNIPFINKYITEYDLWDFWEYLP